MAQPPVDPNVAVPPSVAAAAAAAEAAHAKAYNTPPVVQDAPPPPAATPPAPLPQDAPPPADATPPAPLPQDTPPPPAANPGTPPTQDQIDWEARYRAMEGRYKQATRTNGIMQEQMRELGDELIQHQRMQGVTAAPSTPQARPLLPQTPQPPQRLITEKDVETFGPEFLDTVQRAALDAAQPILAQVQDQVKKVSQTLTKQQKHSMAQQLTAAVPEWRQINESDRFKEWAGLRDVYSGQVRGNLLNAAIRQGDISRAVAFFKGFLDEEQATGQLPPQGAAAPGTPPRSPAVPLATLAAPGRAQPAQGTPPSPQVDKPIITHRQIATFYDHVRKGAYAGRDADKAAHEQMIFSAMQEGRIR